jgi:hypothetical protein
MREAATIQVPRMQAATIIERPRLCADVLLIGTVL